MVKQERNGQSMQNRREFFEKRNKILEYPAGIWAKQKIMKQVPGGLCFFVEVVYNKIAVTLRLLVCFAQRSTKKWQYLECFLEPYWVCG